MKPGDVRKLPDGREEVFLPCSHFLLTIHAYTSEVACPKCYATFRRVSPATFTRRFPSSEPQRVKI
jgi:hypothetical protein